MFTRGVIFLYYIMFGKKIINSDKNRRKLRAGAILEVLSGYFTTYSEEVLRGSLDSSLVLISP